jgi:malate synthase
VTDLNGIVISEHDLREEVFTPEAIFFVGSLVRAFGDRRNALLVDRRIRQDQFDAGERPDFLSETAEIRSRTWTIDPAPQDLLDRRVEITGPPDRKMMINALNSGARVFMADFEDSSTPNWENILNAQINVRDAIRGDLTLQHNGKNYAVNDDPATLVVRPRGWHLPERHVQVDGHPAPASLVDFGLVFFHNVHKALSGGSAPYFYLPKLENHQEARLWNDVFCHAQDALGVPRGSIKATVLIETITAAFEMDEILYELREHSAGLNAGRWDYIFSVAKKFKNDPTFVLPDRSSVSMTAPFMRAYTELMVATCHKRGAHAIGGMAAFIPNRRDPEVTTRALSKVKEDKRREAEDGCDGTWVAHPDLVEVAEAEFNAVLGKKSNQIDRQRPDVQVNAEDLLSVDQTSGRITRDGLETNVYIGLHYIASWLSGTGAVAIYNLMEDAATAEISRAQIWQWVRHSRLLEDGTTVTAELVRATVDEQLAILATDLGVEAFAALPFDKAKSVFEQVALDSEFTEFLTLPAYELLG